MTTPSLRDEVVTSWMGLGIEVVKWLVGLGSQIRNKRIERIYGIRNRAKNRQKIKV